MIERKHALGPLLLAAIAVSSIAACSSAPDDAGATSSAAEAIRAGDPALCPVTSTALVLTPSTSPEAACPRVAGKGGTWTITAGTQPVACTPNDDGGAGAETLCEYTWTPAAQQAPDLAALEAIPGVDVASVGEEDDDDCTKAAMLRFATITSLEGVTCPTKAGGGGNGPKGCDVCGTLIDPGVIFGHMLIPSAAPVRTFVVPMTNGSNQVVTLASPSPSAGAARSTRGARSFVDVTLPKPPRGVRYVDGPVRGYGNDP